MDSLKEKETILNDNLWRVMWNLSWPAVIAMVLYGLNSVFDAIFVGRFVGDDALAGVSIAYPLSSITLALGSLIGVGAGSFLSIALGANDRESQERLMGNVNSLTIILSIIYTLMAWIFAEPIVKLIGGGEGAALAPAISYFRITVLASVFWTYGLAANMIVRAEGRMKSAALIMGLGLLINIIANYVLIVIFKLGVEGAAWGTNLGMLIYTVVGFIYFSSGRASFKANALAFHWDKRIVSSIISMGMPSLIMMIMFLIQSVIIFNALSRYGTTYDVAFYGAVFRIYNLLLTPIYGLMRALQPVIGINFGAKRYDRVIKSFWIFLFSSILCILPFWTIIMVNPQSVLAMMFREAGFSAANLMNFRLFVSILPLLSVVFMTMTLFPAINKGRPAAVVGMARQLIFYIPVMLIMPRLFGINWVYIGAFCIDTLIALIAVLLVTREFSRLKQRSAAT